MAVTRARESLQGLKASVARADKGASWAETSGMCAGREGGDADGWRTGEQDDLAMFYFILEEERFLQRARETVGRRYVSY